MKTWWKEACELKTSGELQRWFTGLVTNKAIKKRTVRTKIGRSLENISEWNYSSQNERDQFPGKTGANLWPFSPGILHSVLQKHPFAHYSNWFKEPAKLQRQGTLVKENLEGIEAFHDSCSENPQKYSIDKSNKGPPPQMDEYARKVAIGT